MKDPAERSALETIWEPTSTPRCSAGRLWKCEAESLLREWELSFKGCTVPKAV